MIVYIPIAEGQKVPLPVLNSILEQGADAETVATQGERASLRNYTAERISGEVNSRNKCREKFLESGEDFCVIQDRKLAHLFADNIEKMQKFLMETGWGAVALNRNNPMLNKHIVLGCVMFTRKCLELVKFHNKYGHCLCKEVEEDILANKMDYGYIDSVVRLKEV